MRILYQDRNLKFTQIGIRSEQTKKTVKIRRRVAYIPPTDHPLRKFKIGKTIPQNVKSK